MLVEGCTLYRVVLITGAGTVVAQSNIKKAKRRGRGGGAAPFHPARWRREGWTCGSFTQNASLVPVGARRGAQAGRRARARGACVPSAAVELMLQRELSVKLPPPPPRHHRRAILRGTGPAGQAAAAAESAHAGQAAAAAAHTGQTAAAHAVGRHAARAGGGSSRTGGLLNEDMSCCGAGHLRPPPPIAPPPIAPPPIAPPPIAPIAPNPPIAPAAPGALPPISGVGARGASRCSTAGAAAAGRLEPLKWDARRRAIVARRTVVGHRRLHKAALIHRRHLGRGRAAAAAVAFGRHVPLDTRPEVVVDQRCPPGGARPAPTATPARTDGAAAPCIDGAPAAGDAVVGPAW